MENQKTHLTIFTGDPYQPISPIEYELLTKLDELFYNIILFEQDNYIYIQMKSKEKTLSKPRCNWKLSAFLLGFIC